MEKSRSLVALVFAFVLITMTSCGGGGSPTAEPTPAPALVDYTISGAESSAEVPVTVDDELWLFIDSQPIVTVAWSGVARFQAYPGNVLVMQGVDTCQGQYWISEIWLHRSGAAPRRIGLPVTSCTVASVPCLPVDCAAPDRVFSQQVQVLP